MAEFKVFDQDGQEFGPVDTKTVREWLAEGRIAEEAVVVRLDDNSMSTVGELLDDSQREFAEDLGTYLSGRVRVVVGDITKQRVDAIVNAANSTLLGGGGVDGAIHLAGGPAILEECKQLRQTSYPRGLPTGQAVLTAAGNMPANWVIHTVGPVFGAHANKEASLLESCYYQSLARAVEKQCSTIAFPAVSTGVFGYPGDQAAAVSSSAIARFLETDSTISEVRLVFFARQDAQVFQQNHSF